MKKNTRQQGYILLVTLVLLVVGAAVWFGQGGGNNKAQHAYEESDKERLRLNEVKSKLLNHMVLAPEIYQRADENSPPRIEATPQPGYFPNCDCGDSGDGMCIAGHGDGTSDSFCKNKGDDVYRPYFLPRRLKDRHVFLSYDKREYYYVVDEAFVIRNKDIAQDKPLNPFSPNVEENIKPVLRLDNSKTPYVALIIKARPKSGVIEGSCPANNSCVTFHQVDADHCSFVATMGYENCEATDDDLKNVNYKNGGANSEANNDIIVGISFDEWKAAVKRRVCNLQASLMQASASTPFWFNQYDVANNPIGGSWRQSVEQGLCDE